MMCPVSQYGRRDPKRIQRGTGQHPPDSGRGDGGTIGNSSSIAAVTTPDEGETLVTVKQTRVEGLGSVPRKIHEKMMRWEFHSGMDLGFLKV